MRDFRRLAGFPVFAVGPTSPVVAEWGVAGVAAALTSSETNYTVIEQSRKVIIPAVTQTYPPRRSNSNAASATRSAATPYSS